jgi:hypothetical protein
MSTQLQEVAVSPYDQLQAVVQQARGGVAEDDKVRFRNQFLNAIRNIVNAKTKQSLSRRRRAAITKVAGILDITDRFEYRQFLQQHQPQLRID